MSSTKAHCNSCNGDRNHEVLHTEETSWADEDHGVSGRDKYETLKCLGCDSIKLRHTSWFSEDDTPTINYFPPAISRAIPHWFHGLVGKLPSNNWFVEELLREIYVALQNNLPNLATMGVRSLIEKIMISKTGDQGTFAKNLTKFQELGYVSRIQRGHLETILDAGHATIHRSFSPKTVDVMTIVDITEHIVESVYLHGSKITALKKRVPPRAMKP
jgi:hypothetical protein